MERKYIKSVREYLDEISIELEKMKKRCGIEMFVFRGEPEEYPNPGIPNLFRGENYTNYKNINGYEQSIIDEVKSNNLSNNLNELEIAMDAQHGGFPSRLLDVSFNSLIALFFAVTPHFKYNVDSLDQKDGVVLIYAVDGLYNSNSECIKNKYKEILLGKTNVLNSFFHYLVDYSEVNERIKAQQGAFILFDGNQSNPIPKWREVKVIIDANSKEKIRRELEKLFGLTIGTIYPFSDTMKDYIMSKVKILKQNIDYYEEISLELQKEYEYEYIEYLNNVNKKGLKRSEKIKNIILLMEKVYKIEKSIEITQKYSEEKKDLYEDINLKLQEYVNKIKEIIEKE